MGPTNRKEETISIRHIINIDQPKPPGIFRVPAVEFSSIRKIPQDLRITLEAHGCQGSETPVARTPVVVWMNDDGDEWILDTR